MEGPLVGKKLFSPSSPWQNAPKETFHFHTRVENPKAAFRSLNHKSGQAPPGTPSETNFYTKPVVNPLVPTSLGDDSPVFSAILLFKNQIRFPRVSGGFSKEGSLERMGPEQPLDTLPLPLP